MKKVALIVSRSPAFRAYVRWLGLADHNTEILTFVGPRDEHLLNGRVVLGMLPYRLARRCREVVQVDLLHPQQIKANDLTLAQMQEYGCRISRYKIEWLGDIEP